MSVNSDIEPFMDKKILRNTTHTQELLFNRGFKKIYFTTSDNIKICGLLLDQSHTKKITHTIIYCAGFYPGNKEGMSSFYTLVANEPYNILLFDARGHNESEGSLWSYRNLKQYGTIEYLDIVAAVKFINEYNQTHHINPDIVIHGICSGAFHTIKAVDHMTKQSCPECNIIKGIVFDSGWLRISDVIETTIQAEVNKQLSNSYFSWLTRPLTWLIHSLYKITLKTHHDSQSDIKNVIKQITIPTWFVHCQNDPYIPIQPMKKCVEGCNTKQYWWIEHNSHANYHMIKHEEYQEKLLKFLKKL